ncbi:hypothetical protein CL629_03215 [bacterium]|nr:hypothetical protein [bacterium]|tara:strand:+ start:5159 stop:5524 length:366 start_codon:yes stop_codon:yes gene_type:complete
MIQPFFALLDWGFLLLRIALGVVLIIHAFPRLRRFGSPGGFWAGALGVFELLGGLAIALGFLTQIIAGLFVIEFLVILFAAQRKASFKEKQVSILVLGAMLLLVTGGGAFSLDETIGWIFY